MIIGYNIFGKGLHGQFFDTAIPTTQIDELTIGAGIYDELYISLDTTISNVNNKPTEWFLKNIINPKFQGNLEAGSLSANNHKVTEIQLYRRKVGDQKDWTLIGRFSYEFKSNVYSVVDNTAENDAYYQYAIVPIADDVTGELTISDPVHVEYKGVYLTDLDNNYRLQIDFEMGDVKYNKNSSTMTPLNGEFPVMVFGNQNYRTGNVTFLPITQEQIDAGGTTIDGRAERIQRDKVVNFLNNGKAKILRNDNGDIMIIATSGVESTPMEHQLMDVHSVAFDYTELGKVNSQTLVGTGLVAGATKSSYTYDERGEVIWDI